MAEETARKLPIWLILSLLVNALLIGVMIGGGLGNRKGDQPRGPRGGGEQALIRSIDRAIPDAERRQMRQALRQAYHKSGPEREAVQAARQALSESLGAEPYDVAKTKQAFEALRVADVRMKARIQDLVAEQVGALTLEQRKAIIQSLERRSQRREARRGVR